MVSGLDTCLQFVIYHKLTGTPTFSNYFHVILDNSTVYRLELLLDRLVKEVNACFPDLEIKLDVHVFPEAT